MTTISAIASFNGVDGEYPVGNVVADAQGNLFGVSLYGSAVYEVGASTFGAMNSPSLIATFPTENIANFYPDLVIDAPGNLLVTAGYYSGQQGDTEYQGVYELAKGQGGYSSTPQLVAQIQVPYASYTNDLDDLSIGPNGDLFATGQDIDGSHDIFEVSRTGSGYASTLVPVAALGGSGSSNLIADKTANLFGTETFGNGSSAVYELPKTADGYSSTTVLLATFSSDATEIPTGNLVLDASGDILGVAINGSSEGGVIYEIVKTANGYAGTPTILAAFADGSFADGEGLVLGPGGNIFGLTYTGYVYELPKTSAGYGGLISLGMLNSDTGTAPAYCSLYADPAGNLYGTASAEGLNGYGTVFEVTGEVSCFCRGTRLATPDGSHLVESLGVGDAVLTFEGDVAHIVSMTYSSVDCRYHANPSTVWPVRISAHAFGINMPCCDLWLSPDHAVFFQETLIPIKYLINGINVKQMPVDEVEYFHVKLTNHAILLADGLPAESYLERSKQRSLAYERHLFNSSTTTTLHWESYGRAPLIVTGPVVERVQDHLNVSAGREIPR